MKPVIFAAAIACMTAVPALGGDVPFAAPPPSRPGQLDQMMMPGLGEFMSMIQTRHIKLWYAGKFGNWDLADYQLDRIAENLNKAALLYTGIPVTYVTAVQAPLTEMRDAAQAKNAAQFIRGYADLTAACNSCHQAGNVRFIQIRTPIASPFGDEDYHPPAD
ncbi:hypothetical protein [Labrys monachus]|uniref:Cytochrome c domain-containing protein n=1 Tax=Labrys monachus TaxID=217067 RepID=A0ABU0F900_9HYPH|nr:hypothetical protein [Labrys monachus]MDQ0391089.1 hypothetical protein [Labrys monachus]